jgi:prepilin-type N-terminal cleavage/methylation domain-containing protein
MKTNPKMSRGFTLVELLVVIVIIAALAGLTAPLVMKQVKNADKIQAVSNARQVGLALFEFEGEYSSFPDDATAVAVKEATDTALVSGNSANDRLRQLIRAGLIQSEDVFFTKTSYTKKPDNVTENDKALAKGEVGFGMVVTTDNKGLSSSGNPSRPLLATPFTSALNKPEFDVDAYLGKAVILKADNSVAVETIVPTSKAVKLGGKSMLQDGEGTVWGASNPVKFAYPEGKSSTTTTDKAMP